MVDAQIAVRPIIGLEIHVQLLTRSKMFCGCPVRFDDPPNSLVCPVCMGLPGALPVINRRAVELTILTGLAFGGTIATHTKWDRKSYYYPDLPKNYQISQFDLPLVSNGHLDVDVGHGEHRVRIRRAHLEEDAGKNVHDVGGHTLVDLNRAGTPLLEIVTEPDLRSAEEACALCTGLHRLVTYLGVSEGNMKKGQMRFEPNVNVAIEHDGVEYRTPISEIKNLNSFRAARDAIDFEIDRQVAAWHEDHSYVLGSAPNENRGFDADRGVTEFQRDKEAAQDYRYFPDPDLVPVNVSDAMLNEIRQSLPELPDARTARWVKDHSLSVEDAATVVGHRATADLFDAVISAGGPPAIVIKQFVNVWLSHAKQRGVTIGDLGIDPERMAELAQIVADGTISKTAADRVAEIMLARNRFDAGTEDASDTVTPSVARTLPTTKANNAARCPSPLALAKELRLLQVRDTAATDVWIDEVFAANEQAVQDAMTNPKKRKAAAGFLRGQVMKKSQGKADPKLVGELIDKRLTGSA